MRKIVLMLLSFLLLLPLTLHGSGAYFTDSECVGVSITAAEESPFYFVTLSADGADVFTPSISQGVNNTFEVHFYEGQSYSKDTCIGTITNFSPDRAQIDFDPYDKNLEDYVNFHPISKSWIDSDGGVFLIEISPDSNKIPDSPPDEGYDVSFSVKYGSNLIEFTFKVFVHKS